MSKPKVRWYSDRRAFWLLALLNCVAWSWLFLIDDARLSNSAFTGYLTITIAFLIVVFISTTCFWYTIKYLNSEVKSSKNWYVILKIFFVWAFVELLISWLVAIVWMGRGGSWSSLFPFSSFTPWLMWTPLGFISRFVGFYGVSAVFVTGIFVFSVKKLRRYGLVFIVSVIFITLLSWTIYSRLNGTRVTATIVSEQLGSPGKITAGKSSFVVLPEYGLDTFNTKQDIDSKRIQTNGKVYFVGSQQIPSVGGHTNTLVFGDSLNGITSKQDKSRLIPGGEYLSFPGEILLRAFSPGTYTNFQVMRSVVKGKDKLKPFVIDDNIKLGSAACSSIIATEDYRSLVNQGATVLTNSASLEIFKGSRLFNWQHRGLAKFMAVANARPFLQSSNNWPAFALDQSGHQIAEIQPVGSTSVTIKTNKVKTPYTILGEWVAYVGGIWLAIDLIIKWRAKSKT